MLNDAVAFTDQWDSCLEEFRSFGGSADNVIQRQGRFGLGLFPADPTRTVTLNVPDHLLVPADLVDLRISMAMNINGLAVA